MTLFIAGYKGVRGVGKDPFEAQCNARANWQHQKDVANLPKLVPESISYQLTLI